MKLSIFIVIVSCLFMVTFGAECDMDYCEKHIRGSSLKNFFILKFNLFQKLFLNVMKKATIARISIGTDFVLPTICYPNTARRLEIAINVLVICYQFFVSTENFEQN